jgi:hypothetical protein
LTVSEELLLQEGPLPTPFWAVNSMAADPRVWCAMIYVADSRDVAGAVRRSKRLQWKQADARREVEQWITEMGLDPVRWEIADDETLIGRIPGHFVVVSSLLLPKEERN